MPAWPSCSGWDGGQADALFDRWANQDKQLIAPAFFEVETDSILRQKVALLRNELTAEQAEAAFARLQGLPIQQVSESGAEGKGVEDRHRIWFCDCIRRDISRIGRITGL